MPVATFDRTARQTQSIPHPPHLFTEADHLKFWSFVFKTPTCWLWRGALSNGYGQLHVKNRLHGKLNIIIHRWMCERFIGPIPQGFHVDHLCRVTQCVNPAHLELVTRRENMLRGKTVGARNASKTHCIHGHEFTPANTYRPNPNHRHCRQCAKEYQRRFRARRAKNG